MDIIISKKRPGDYTSFCPKCGNDVFVESSTPFGDVPCPWCGHLLWFVQMTSDQWFFDKQEIDEIQCKIIEQKLAVSPIDSMDSMDFVEVTFLLEELNRRSST